MGDDELVEFSTKATAKTRAKATASRVVAVWRGKARDGEGESELLPPALGGSLSSFQGPKLIFELLPTYVIYEELTSIS